MKKLVVALILVIAVMGMGSCTLVNGLFYPYIGVWEGTVETGTTATITLEKDSYEMVMAVEISNVSIDMYAVKGELVVEQDSMIMTPTHQKEYDEVAEALPSEWTEVSGLGALPQVGTWAVDGDTLTFTEDGESISFTRVE